MTPNELLEALHSDGLENGGLYHDDLGGFFGWSVGYENGDAVLTVGFTDPEAPILDTKQKWKLTPVRGNNG